MPGRRSLIHSSRWRAMSGRFCSLASSVFFESLPMPDQKARQACRSRLGAGLSLQRLGQLRHGDIRLLLDLFQEKVLVRGQLAHAAAAAPGSRRARAAKAIHKLDRAAGAHAKMVRSTTPRAAAFNEPDDPRAQIQGIIPTLVERDSFCGIPPCREL